MSKKMILLIVAGLIGLGLLAYGIYLLTYNYSSDYSRGKVSINDYSYNVDVADTMAKRAQGLSGREPLSEKEAMLFLFSTTSVQSFWMKDMKFPIDIIWINGDTIIGVAQNVPAPEEGQYVPPSYYSTGPVDKVLEISAGGFAKNGFKIGDKINFDINTSGQTVE